MPSTVRLDHSISGPELDALRAGTTAPHNPTARPATGASINAWMLDEGKLWPVAVVLAVLVVIVAVLGAWRSMRTPVVAYAPPAAQVAEVDVPALTPRPTETREAIYAAAPSLTVYCDGQQRELTSAQQMTPHYRAGCVAAYGWCETCQDAWASLHP
jgi:hypothetical protein